MTDSAWETETYEIIKPVWEITGNRVNGAQTIKGWMIVGRCMASNRENALRFGRREYGDDIDVRLVSHSVKA